MKLRRFQTSGYAYSLIDLAGYTELTAEAFIAYRLPEELMHLSY